MLYIIGLGLSEKSISLEGIEKLKKCKKIYLENYTVEFPYSLEKLEKNIDRKIIPADRELVEGNDFILEAKKQDVALLIYGSPLMATTHISLIHEAKKQGVNYKIFHNASVLDVVSETGLQLYKFGKITSIPIFESESFIDVIKENQKINAHSLILIDIGLSFKGAIDKLESVIKKNNIKMDRIIVCSMLGGDNSKIYYDNISKLRELKISPPFCFVLPGKMHFVEEDFLRSLS